MSKLTAEEVAFYRAHGYYLYKKPLFSPEKMARLEMIFEEHLAEKGDKLSDELSRPHFSDKRLLEFLLADEVLDLVEPISGPDIMLWSSAFICKDPYKGRQTPWHEDSAYWYGRFDKYDNIVTVWLAIDRSTKENGCMRVIPGTHHNGFSEYESVDMSVNTFYATIKNIDESQAVDFELEKGECSLHDARIIHGAEANKSPYRRCGYTMRFLPADTQVIPEKNENWQVFLARGKDRAGNQYVNV